MGREEGVGAGRIASVGERMGWDGESKVPGARKALGVASLSGRGGWRGGV